MNSLDGSLDWYVVHLRSRHHAHVETNLHELGYKVFAPTYSPLARIGGRAHRSKQPLFPGYLFCALNPERRLPVLMVGGVIGILGAGKTLIPVAPEEIDAIRRAVASGLYYEPVPNFLPGDRVRVASGPLAGVVGVVAQHKGVRSLLISISLLNRSVAVELDKTSLEPADGPMGARTGRAA
jgi:transcription termination/antitermination protein NusG